MEELIQSSINYILNPELISPTFHSVWSVARGIFFTISIILIGLLVFLLSVNSYLDLRFRERYTEFKKAKPYHEVKLDTDWKEVSSQAQDEKEAERKLAVIEADDMLNSALEQIGYSGANLVEKLNGLNEEIIPNLEDVKKAHKTRRDIIYDQSRDLSKEEAKEIISIYEKVFKELQIF